jgi:hypothetical protein
MKTKNEGQVIEIPKKKMKCGIIMPIAPHPDYPTEHWKDVLGIISEAIEETDFEPQLVSDDVAIGLIHDRIVNNIYTNEIIVCDVSSKNPNVMFELGLRLAFDKPTIIIKDETTGYSFDTGVIEHISYPSSLRFSQIVKFKEELIRRIQATYEKSEAESNYSPFLKSFGKTITPASINQSEIPEGRYILNQIEEMRQEMRIMRIEQKNYSNIQVRDIDRYGESGKRNILTSILNKYMNRNLTNDLIMQDDKLLSIIKRELVLNGIDISNIELKEFIQLYSENQHFRK